MPFWKSVIRTGISSQNCPEQLTQRISVILPRMTSAQIWISAFRLRTLPLALSATTLGSLLGYADPSGDSVTTVFSAVEKNSGVDPDTVWIRPPPGTKIVTSEGGMPWR